MKINFKPLELTEEQQQMLRECMERMGAELKASLAEASRSWEHAQFRLPNPEYDFRIRCGPVTFPVEAKTKPDFNL